MRPSDEDDPEFQRFKAGYYSLDQTARERLLDFLDALSRGSRRVA
jgi:hypothetical protein